MRQWMLTIFFFVITLSNVLARLTNYENERTLADFHKIIWQLDLDESYASFYLVFVDETEYTGYDGCNWFYGTYTLKGDTIVTEELFQTLRACDGVKTYSLWHFNQPLSYEITVRELLLKNEDITYTYRSNYTKDTKGTPLAEKKWQLETSTHSGLNELSGTNIPEISFNEEREYEIRWNCTDDNLFGCNRYAGYWGLGENNRLTFYRRSTQISGASHASTVAQLEKADAFAIVDNKLILKENEDTWYRFASIPTSAEHEEIPISYELHQNYPNPFNPSTQIRFALPETAHVHLAVFNLLGQEVATLVNETRSAGWHDVTFDASGLSSSVFIYRLEAGDYVETRSMMFVK